MPSPSVLPTFRGAPPKSVLVRKASFRGPLHSLTAILSHFLSSADQLSRFTDLLADRIDDSACHGVSVWILRIRAAMARNTSARTWMRTFANVQAAWRPELPTIFQTEHREKLKSPPCLPRRLSLASGRPLGHAVADAIFQSGSEANAFGLPCRARSSLYCATSTRVVVARISLDPQVKLAHGCAVDARDIRAGNRVVQFLLGESRRKTFRIEVGEMHLMPAPLQCAASNVPQFRTKTSFDGMDVDQLNTHVQQPARVMGQLTPLLLSCAS